MHQMFRIGLDRFLQPLYLRALTEGYMDADKIPLAGLFATMSFATVMMLALLYLSVVGGRGRAALVCTAVGEHAAVGAGRVLCHL